MQVLTTRYGFEFSALMFQKRLFSFFFTHVKTWEASSCCKRQSQKDVSPWQRWRAK